MTVGGLSQQIPLGGRNEWLVFIVLRDILMKPEKHEIEEENKVSKYLSTKPS